MADMLKCEESPSPLQLQLISTVERLITVADKYTAVRHSDCGEGPFEVCDHLRDFVWDFQDEIPNFDKDGNAIEEEDLGWVI